MDVTVTPLLGGNDRGPCCYLLSINSVSILLDCGWAEPYDVQMLDPLRDRVGEVDAVLLSHADPAHCGALPYLTGKLGMVAPIYATGAVHKMGQMFMYNAYLNYYASSDFESFNLDDVDAAFEKIIQLRYKQEVILFDDQQLTVSITPLPAGRLLGGTVWRLVAGGEEFVYAMDFNHKRDRHLIGTPLESAFLRPALCIADAGASGRMPVDRERVERTLIDACLSCLRGEGNVLIPVDAAGRLLELLLIFEEYWSKHKLPYPVILLGPMVQTTLEFARSQLEWMNENLVKLLGHSRENPFLLRHVKLCASLAEYRRLPISGPRVVLAVDASLNAGPARNLLVEWASNPKNLIILPCTPPLMSWASQILTMAELRDAKVGFGSSMPRLEVSLSKRVALKGQELEEYRRMKEEQRKAAEAALHTLTLENMDTDEIKKQGQGGESPTGGGGDAEFIRKPGRKSRGSVGSAAMGESPRSSAFYQQPTRANVMSIGHAARDSTGVYMMDVDDAMSLNPVKPDSFDLELDDSAPEDAGACLIEGFDLGYGAVAPIFPNEDEWEQDAAQFDEYGAPVDLELLAGEGEDQGRLGRALASEAEAERGEFALPLGDGEGKGHEDIAPERDIPTKIETTMVPLDLAAKVIRLDLDGRADDRSVRNILTHIAPQNIILVHAEEESLGAMARRLETELEGLHTSVKVSMASEPVTVGLGSSYEVQLSEDVMDAIEMHAVGGYELGWVNGKLDTLHDVENEGESLPVLHASKVTGILQNTEQNGNAGDQLTTTMTAVEGRNDAAYGGVFIGDVRLSELKKALATAGVLSEFHGGGLFCQGNVVIRRHGDAGGLLLEGVAGEEYYKVRDIIYGQYHIC